MHGFGRLGLAGVRPPAERQHGLRGREVGGHHRLQQRRQGARRDGVRGAAKGIMQSTYDVRYI